MSEVLNWIWAGLALCALAECLCRSTRSRATCSARLFGLICVLTLLFPVISDNDDLLLQQQSMNIPDSPLLKNLLKQLAACDNTAVPARCATDFLFPRRAVQERISAASFAFVSAITPGATGQRSPPATL